MSTRSQITVKGQPVKLYKHSDGYPAGVLPVLVPFVKDFMDRRGFDDCYMMARLTMAFGEAEEAHRQERLAGDPRWADMYKERSLLGFGLDTEWHGDIEYAYVIHDNGDIYVHEARDMVEPIAVIGRGTSLEDALNLCGE